MARRRPPQFTLASAFEFARAPFGSDPKSNSGSNRCASAFGRSRRLQTTIARQQQQQQQINRYACNASGWRPQSGSHFKADLAATANAHRRARALKLSRQTQASSCNLHFHRIAPKIARGFIFCTRLSIILAPGRRTRYLLADYLRADLRYKESKRERKVERGNSCYCWRERERETIILASPASWCRSTARYGAQLEFLMRFRLEQFRANTRENCDEE